MDMIQTLAQELNKDPRHVENVVRLLDEGVAAHARWQTARVPCQI